MSSGRLPVRRGIRYITSNLDSSSCCVDPQARGLQGAHPTGQTTEAGVAERPASNSNCLEGLRILARIIARRALANPHIYDSGANAERQAAVVGDQMADQSGRVLQ